MLLKNRLPSLQQILAVFGIILLIFYGWTLIWFFWKLPSWEYFLTLGEISTILAYSMATNLLESLAVLLVPLLISIILPKNWFKDFFISRASSLVILGLGYTMLITKYITSENDYYPQNLVRLLPLAGVLILVLTFLIDRIPLLHKLLGGLADRATIFSYIFAPLGLISLLVVIVRNIF
jgi:hypothetical protein